MSRKEERRKRRMAASDAEAGSRVQESDFKLERPDELSKFIQGATVDEPGLLCETKMERLKDPDNGEWRGRRVLTLYLTKRRNGVTA